MNRSKKTNLLSFEKHCQMLFYKLLLLQSVTMFDLLVNSKANLSIVQQGESSFSSSSSSSSPFFSFFSFLFVFNSKSNG